MPEILVIDRGIAKSFNGPVMKPKKKTILVERWCCGIESHHHVTERVASQCIERRSKMKGWIQPKRTNHEMAIFSKRVEDGEKFTSIAVEMGVSAARARQLVLKHRSKEGK